jgi:hypothetical protein
MVAGKGGLFLIFDFVFESAAPPLRFLALFCCCSSYWLARVARGGGEGALTLVDLVVGGGVSKASAFHHDADRSPSLGLSMLPWWKLLMFQW